MSHPANEQERPKRPVGEGQWNVVIALTPTIVASCPNAQSAIVLQQMWFWQNLDTSCYEDGLSKICGLTGLSREIVRRAIRRLSDRKLPEGADEKLPGEAFIKLEGKPRADQWDQTNQWSFTEKARAILGDFQGSVENDIGGVSESTQGGVEIDASSITETYQMDDDDRSSDATVASLPSGEESLAALAPNVHPSGVNGSPADELADEELLEYLHKVKKRSTVAKRILKELDAGRPFTQVREQAKSLWMGFYVMEEETLHEEEGTPERPSALNQDQDDEHPEITDIDLIEILNPLRERYDQAVPGIINDLYSEFPGLVRSGRRSALKFIERYVGDPIEVWENLKQEREERRERMEERRREREIQKAERLQENGWLFDLDDYLLPDDLQTRELKTGFPPPVHPDDEGEQLEMFKGVDGRRVLRGDHDCLLPTWEDCDCWDRALREEQERKDRDKANLEVSRELGNLLYRQRWAMRDSNSVLLIHAKVDGEFVSLEFEHKDRPRSEAKKEALDWVKSQIEKVQIERSA